MLRHPRHDGNMSLFADERHDLLQHEGGTSCGISTIHVAAALRDNGGGRVSGSEFEPFTLARDLPEGIDLGWPTSSSPTAPEPHTHPRAGSSRARRGLQACRHAIESAVLHPDLHLGDDGWPVYGWYTRVG
jgi:hypothetical protein